MKETINVNVILPIELNEKRKALNLTWREVIEAGLSIKENPTGISPALLEPLMSEALQNLGRVWNLIKRT